MKELSSFIESLKDFILDIMGYLIPGFCLVSISMLFVRDLYDKMESKLGIETIGLVIITIAYVMGYVIYGIGIFKDNLLNSYNKRISNTKIKKFKISTTLETIKKIESSEEKKASVEIIEKIHDENGKKLNDSFYQSLNTNSTRSLAMSYTPLADKKVYIFMFRADLSHHVGIVFSISGIFGIILFFLRNIPFIQQSFSISIKLLILDLILILCAWFLGKTRQRFYSIAMRIPFSMFLAEYYKIKK